MFNAYERVINNTKDTKLKGTKRVEVPYFAERLEDNSKSVLIIGERRGNDGISQTVHDLGFSNVTTTDYNRVRKDSWANGVVDWEHIEIDFLEYDEEKKYDYILSISVFEHFGFWFAKKETATELLTADDTFHWNADLRGIQKACNLLKDEDSELIVALPAGPYMNYLESGEPFLRYYDTQRQNIVKRVVDVCKCEFVDEKFYHTTDLSDFTEVNQTVTKNHNVISEYTPNLIWAFTVKRKR